MGGLQSQLTLTFDQLVKKCKANCLLYLKESTELTTRTWYCALNLTTKSSCVGGVCSKVELIESN